ncbi:HNH endonuclease signature motif containing protein [Corynebacterium sp.]|uniref:HNH endonuclease signature motif containing protein n=1 Tax=Corynebacterium sp. TaxID=1720 RepID=UPI0026DFC4D1|nr:HNH endonuclease signature motif containing protein [Corynebacterium sp.]MDO5512628.1 HNH endonuclease signature motif containing protein [Corynebacterium sp.]
MLAIITDRTDTDLAADISDSHVQLTHHKARFILSAAEFDRRELARAHGAPNTATWLQRTFGLSRATAYEYLGVGRKLQDYPQLAQEFLNSSFSYSVVRLLLRYLTEDNVEELIDLARRHPLAELVALLAGRDQPDARPTLNKISVVVDQETGDVRIWGRLDPERGAEFLAALKISELANLIDLDNVEQKVLDDPEAVERLIDDARSASQPAESKEEPEGPASRSRFGTGLSVTVFTAFMGLINMARCHPVSRLRAPGAEVNVLYTQDGRAYLPGHHGGQTGQLLRHLVNGSVRFHLLNRRGLTLKVTRSTRLASPAQVKALLTAWGFQCAGPGCSHTRFLEFHHILDWQYGGATELPNLLPLCAGCHALVSAGIMTIVVDTDPAFLRFRFPGGESYTSENRGLAMTDASLGAWGDKYFSGPVPKGDEHLLQVWEHEDSFADPEPAEDPQSPQLRTPEDLN